MTSTPETPGVDDNPGTGEESVTEENPGTGEELATQEPVADESGTDESAGVPALPDPALLEARDLALLALREITPEASIGDPAGHRVEADGVVSLLFANRLAGYPGWFWTVSLARVADAEPTVLEVELLPGDDALVAPDWVPWAERLADYQAAQAAAQEGADDDASDFDDDDDDDEADDDASILHAGDVDGVDIDELAPDADSDEDDDSDDDESDQDESDEDDDGSDEDDSEDEDESEDDVSDSDDEN